MKKVTIQFTQKRGNRITTRCTIKRDGQTIASASVVKHRDDEDDFDVASCYAYHKAIDLVGDYRAKTQIILSNPEFLDEDGSLK